MSLLSVMVRKSLSSTDSFCRSSWSNTSSKSFKTKAFIAKNALDMKKQTKTISHGSSVQDDVEWSHGGGRWARPVRSVTSTAQKAYKYSTQYRIIYIYFLFFRVFLRFNPTRSWWGMSVHTAPMCHLLCKKLHRELPIPLTHTRTRSHIDKYP